MADRAPEEELYDIDTDPYEITNLATSTQPQHKETLARLRGALDTWITETKDQGHLPEPPAITAPFTPEMHTWFGTPPWAQ
jgi:hypothetical protein